jgi:hypothetical protein
MSWVVDGVGRLLAHYLEKPVQGYEPFTPSDPDALRATLQPGDVLLVEGNNHISGVINYLTQSRGRTPRCMSAPSGTAPC